VTPGKQYTAAGGYGDYEANIPKNAEYTKNEPKKKDEGPNRFLLGYKMLTNEQWRWRYSLRSTVRWAITMIIVGYMLLFIFSLNICYYDCIHHGVQILTMLRCAAESSLYV